MSHISKQNKNQATSTLTCRRIEPSEFTAAFEDYVFRTFIRAEPISMHLGLKEPDECIMLFIRQLLQRAKEDGVSLAFYDDTHRHDQPDDGQNGTHRYDPTHSNQLKLPVGYIISIIESIDDPPDKNDLFFHLDKAPVNKRHIYECIGDVLTKVAEGIDLYSMYKARRLLQSFIAGVDPRYSNQGLFTSNATFASPTLY